jgi:L-lactate dehydrogenase
VAPVRPAVGAGPGLGHHLDTARLRFNLGRYFEVATSNVHALIIGEHGDSELPVWSAANIAGRSLHRRLAERPELRADLDDIFVATRDAAYDIIDAKGSTSYGIGMALARVTRAVFRNEKVSLPVSTLLSGEYGQSDLFIGVPTSVGRRGARHVIELDLDAAEDAAFAASAAGLRAAMAAAPVP